jgi:hypothetical protein
MVFNYRFGLWCLIIGLGLWCLIIGLGLWCLIIGLGLWCLTFNNISVISWWSVLLVEETGQSGENHRSVTSH